MLGITAQAISKWEKGHTLPDITFLPRLANCFGISIDRLLGYSYEETSTSVYDALYKEYPRYWQSIFNPLALKVLEFNPPNKCLKLIEIGCKEGADSIFFARNGYEVYAFDISDTALRRTKKYADEVGVLVNLFRGSIKEYIVDEYFDVVYCLGALDYLKKEWRREILERYKAHTKKDGIHVLSVNINKGTSRVTHDDFMESTDWISGELLTYYYDWEILFLNETANTDEKDHNISGVCNQLVARKPSK